MGGISRRDFLKISTAFPDYLRRIALAMPLYYIPQLTKSLVKTNKVALTLDDGWEGSEIEKLTKICTDYDIQVSAFAVGRVLPLYSSAWKEFFNAGNDIFNHTLNHALLAQPGVNIENEILGWEERYKTLGLPGPNHKLLRPPGLEGLNDMNLNSYLASAGYEAIAAYSLISQDTNFGNSSKDIAADIIAKQQGGDIILLHILKKTLDALPAIISSGLINGLEYVTLSSMPGLPIPNKPLIERPKQYRPRHERDDFIF